MLLATMMKFHDQRHMVRGFHRCRLPFILFAVVLILLLSVAYREPQWFKDEGTLASLLCLLVNFFNQIELDKSEMESFNRLTTLYSAGIPTKLSGTDSQRSQCGHCGG